MLTTYCIQKQIEEAYCIQKQIEEAYHRAKILLEQAIKLKDQDLINMAREDFQARIDLLREIGLINESVLYIGEDSKENNLDQ